MLSVCLEVGLSRMSLCPPQHNQTLAQDVKLRKQEKAVSFTCVPFPFQLWCISTLLGSSLTFCTTKACWHSVSPSSTCWPRAWWWVRATGSRAPEGTWRLIRSTSQVGLRWPNQLHLEWMGPCYFCNLVCVFLAFFSFLFNFLSNQRVMRAQDGTCWEKSTSTPRPSPAPPPPTPGFPQCWQHWHQLDHGGKVWSPVEVAEEFSSPESAFCPDFCFSICSTPVPPRYCVKDSHSAKSAGGRLQLNTHTLHPLSVNLDLYVIWRSWSLHRTSTNFAVVV